MSIQPEIDPTRLSDFRADPRNNTMVGRTNHGGHYFSVPYITEIAPNLWQGGVASGLVLPTEIKHLLSLYRWEQYTVNHRLRTSHTVTMYDSLDQATHDIDKWARWVNAR